MELCGPGMWRAGDTAVPVCVPGREKHPLAGYCLVLLPLFAPVYESGMVGLQLRLGVGGRGTGVSCQAGSGDY